MCSGDRGASCKRKTRSGAPRPILAQSGNGNCSGAGLKDARFPSASVCVCFKRNGQFATSGFFERDCQIATWLQGRECQIATVPKGRECQIANWQSGILVRNKPT